VLTFLFIAFAICSAALKSAAAIAGEGDAPVRAVLGQAMQYQIEFRNGKLDVAPAYVSLLETATRETPGNADLWYAMGRAYLLQGARSLLPGGDPAAAMPAMQKGIESLKRALQIDPDQPQALAQLGGVQALRASMANAPDMANRGVAEMNRAVLLAPDSTMVRLTRAFLGLTLPDRLRNHTTEFEDLDYLIQNADVGTAADYVRIMRGDLHFEIGKSELARADYNAVLHTGTAASAEAGRRLADLESGGVPMEKIKALRVSAGAQCSMCHGR
jgi:tetratricopeptide (TPR) repeat protein